MRFPFPRARIALSRACNRADDYADLRRANVHAEIT